MAKYNRNEYAVNQNCSFLSRMVLMMIPIVSCPDCLAVKEPFLLIERYTIDTKSTRRQVKMSIGIGFHFERVLMTNISIVKEKI